jgi:CheY-like chemotaxis protein
MAVHAQPPTVLVVDDEPDSRDLISRVLRERRARVWSAESAAEGLRLFHEHRPGVILSDIGMPVQDGYDFMKTIRLLGPEQGGRTPAAALTALARSEDRTKALMAGFQLHVSKPIEPSELVAVVVSLAKLSDRG